MKGSGAVKYLEEDKAYLVECPWAEGQYVLFDSVSGDPNELYAAVATIRDSVTYDKLVLFNKKGQEISRDTVWNNMDWNLLTEWIKEYNGQTVYMEKDYEFSGLPEEYTVIP